jgi:hypothetical protein
MTPAAQLVEIAFRLAIADTGMIMAARMATIKMDTRISIKVNPDFREFFMALQPCKSFVRTLDGADFLFVFRSSTRTPSKRSRY